MKTNQFFMVAAMALSLSIMPTMAQQGMGKGQGPQGKMGQGQRVGPMCQEIPDMTADQQAKIDALNVPHQKQMLALSNKMGELKARQRTLETADKPDIKAVNGNIDEISKLQNQMMKARAEHRNQVRSTLTDEQKLWFDNHQGKGKGRKMHNGNGNCPAQGGRGYGMGNQ